MNFKYQMLAVRFLRLAVVCLFVISAWGEPTGAAVPFRLGVAGYTFRARTVDDTPAIMQKADVHYLCVKNFHLPFGICDMIKEVR